MSFENKRNDSDLGLSSVSEYTDFSNEEPDPSTQRPKCNPAFCILYPRQIVYDSGPLPKAMNIQAKSTRSQKKLASFVNLHIVKSLTKNI